MKSKIRIAEEKDCAIIAEFNLAMAMETEGKVLKPEVISDGVKAVFEEERKGFYVVAGNDSGKVVGCLLVTYEWSDWRNGWFCWIQSVYILPEARGKKIYSRLYDFVKAMARTRKNVCGFRLSVDKNNSHAQHVYEQVGMEATNYLIYEEET